MANKDLSDKVFIKKLNDILEDNYSREDFDVRELSAKVGFSHTQIHRKIQAEFGKSTSQYIREFRLGKAIELLQDEVISASEVAYKVGFSSPTYFNKCFNSYFGYPPGQAKYLEKIEPEIINQRSGNLISVNHRVSNGEKMWSKWKVPGILLFFIVLFLIPLYLFLIKDKKDRKIGESANSEMSVAVLPFKNLSEDKSNQYFADGVMDDIINHLSAIKEFRVISRTTMDQYKESSKTIPEIGKELSVLYLIESSIQKYRDTVRLIIRLFDARQDKQIGSYDFKGEYGNIFTLESDIAKKMANELKATLTPGEIKRIERIPTENMAAYELYLRGNYTFNSNDNDSLVEYQKLLYRCLELDPDFALAYAALARIKIQRMRSHYIPATNKEIEEAKALAIKSIELDDNSRGHASLGWLKLWFEWNWEEAEKQFRLAIQSNPNDAGGHVYFAEYLYNIKGDFIEARKHLNLALYLAPYEFYPRSVSAYFYFNEGNIIKSIEEVQKMKEIEINNPDSYWRNFHNYITTGEEKMAVDELIQGWERRPEDAEFIIPVKDVFDNSGINGVYHLLINNEKKSSDPYFIAKYYALAGDKNNALKWLEKSYDFHDSSMPYVKYDHLFKDLRTEPRFLTILEKMNLGSY